MAALPRASAVSALLFGLAAGSGYCQSNAEPPPDTSTIAIDFYFDNDAFVRGRDKDYTGGIALAFSAPEGDSPLTRAGRVLSWIDQRFGWRDDIAAPASFDGVEAGFLAFTPEDIGSATPVPWDRPYASLVYGTTLRQTVDFERRRSVISGLTFGIIGLPVVGRLQNRAHEWTGSDRANGWDHQVSAGGEPTAKYSVRWQRHLDPGIPSVQATTITGISVGYLTEATVGASVRTGRLAAPWWSFNVHGSDHGDRTGLLVPAYRPVSEVYVLCGAHVRLRAYNAFLQGQFRDSPVRYTAGDIERLVFEAWVGAGFETDSGLRAAFLLRKQSSEVRAGHADRSYTYGELIASMRY